MYKTFYIAFHHQLNQLYLCLTQDSNSLKSCPSCQLNLSVSVITLPLASHLREKLLKLPPCCTLANTRFSPLCTEGGQRVCVFPFVASRSRPQRPWLLLHMLWWASLNCVCLSVTANGSLARSGGTAAARALRRLATHTHHLVCIGAFYTCLFLVPVIFVPMLLK